MTHIPDRLIIAHRKSIRRWLIFSGFLLMAYDATLLGHNIGSIGGALTCCATFLKDEM